MLAGRRIQGKARTKENENEEKQQSTPWSLRNKRKQKLVIYETKREARIGKRHRGALPD